jgi:hypothetical protein
MIPGMRHHAAVLAVLLLLALSACADDNPVADSAPITPTPSETSSEVPGTRPSPTPSPTPSASEEESASPTVAEDPTPSTGPPTPLSTDSIAATPETLDGYRALATGLGAFFTRAQQVEEQRPGADPQNADEVNELLGDVYPEGVDLVVFEEQNTGLVLCLTGTGATFLLLAGHGDGIRQVFGGGDCDDPASVEAEVDGDVVVDVTFDIAGDSPEYAATVVKGQNLADQIDDLDKWIQVLNKEMAR